MDFVPHKEPTEGFDMKLISVGGAQASVGDVTLFSMLKRGENSVE